MAVPESSAGVQTFRSRGTEASPTAVSAGTQLAPISLVLTGIADIAVKLKAIRQNGVLISSSAEDQGVGNFSNASLHIGRRGGTTFPFNGRLYNLFIRGAYTSDPLVAKVERYLNSKAKVF